MQALTCREREGFIHTDTPTDTPTVRRGAGAHSEELLLAGPLVQPGRPPGNVIQEIGAGVHIRLVNAVTVLALVSCCKPAAHIILSITVPSQHAVLNVCS